MTINVVAVSDADVAKALRLEEGHFVDLKATAVAPGKLTRSLAAFANADGGELFVGIAEGQAGQGHRWEGFANAEAANGHIQAFESVFPLGGDHRYEFLSAESQTGLILHIEIDKSASIKKAVDGKIYKRRGAQNLPVTTEEDIRNLELAKGVVSFESETIQYPIEYLTNSEAIITFLIDLIPSADPEPWLKKQLLVLGSLPTVAAVLLFSDEPQAALPKRSGVKIYRYRTTLAEGTRDTLDFDPITIEGCLYRQIYSAVAKVVEVVEASRAVNADGMSTINYPKEAIHEIVTNAVIHRDYSIADDIHVRIFDNRIEIESPGRLPAHITPENILDQRYSRNGAIVRYINKFPDAPNKDVGEGLNTAFGAMRALKLKNPQIEERESSVLVTIRHERLGSPESICLEYLRDNDTIANAKLRELTGITSENTAKEVFKRLMKMNAIERVPGLGGNKAAYQKGQNFATQLAAVSGTN
ncbi:ATP-dependent DNA helicase RecG [Mycobacterium sp. TNTM28]|uniref:ATP-dependent DNA helicase RecG n=1 Tax=[Mycobacterium] fortunisiensis TaxID=2600579 RepID=A0ABS6KL21_9MYCO|nr:ATP-binding protein [[Mycobacterium] fortunisiensis]MBU9764213.1 ATP-dependent DNA helicase RecG [[Mycobacterium] fortunisiensis]